MEQLDRYSLRQNLLIQKLKRKREAMLEDSATKAKDLWFKLMEAITAGFMECFQSV